MSAEIPNVYSECVFRIVHPFPNHIFGYPGCQRRNLSLSPLLISMLRALRPRATPRFISHPTMLSRSALATAKYVRFNSSEAQGSVPPEGTAAKELDPKKARLREQDKLQKDWDAAELTYEDVKPRAEQPTPVCYSVVVT